MLTAFQWKLSLKYIWHQHLHSFLPNLLVLKYIFKTYLFIKRLQDLIFEVNSWKVLKILMVLRKIFHIFGSNQRSAFNLWFTDSLHKRWSFPLRVFSVNVTKSTVFCGFGHIYWRNLDEKNHFLCSDLTCGKKKSLFVSEGCNLRCFSWKKNWAIATFERLFLIRNNTVNNILMFL